MLAGQCYRDICGYFPGKETRCFAIFSDYKEIHFAQFEKLLSRGYRRSTRVYYRPACDNCRLCLAYRLEVKKFQPDRSQKRTQKMNVDLHEKWAPPSPTEEKEKLYIKYQYFQHYAKPLPGLKKEKFSASECHITMMRQMYIGRSRNIELELRLENTLVAFAVFDISSKGLSAVYSVYDPELASRSLGTEVILRSIAKTIALRKKYYYLGLFIPGHMKMDYKKRFQPAQLYDSRKKMWINYSDLAIREITQIGE